ncbi:transglycosylase [Staphylococcus capitis]|uniref:aggregation-promoting factor C-terminal-like domain-containing protein n=1 Tax=Staphylococcus capitis TaxID=29388 RepID=UPI00203B3E8A|nr:transglycosylase [Staphylococcus capitis]MCM3498905.1 transglycosylase [Staphylococcus capitis]
MKKSILAILATVSIGATGLEAGNTHAAENTNQNYNSTATQTSSSHSSNASSESTSEVYQEFIKAGGTKALWEKIVLPESGGDPNASNGQYHGLGQTNQSWGYGSVATQTKGMINYAKERYGSIDDAISFREANGYW